MATIYREFFVDAPLENVWSAIRDFGAPHRRLTPDIVTDTQLEGSVRTVTFFNGFVVKEQLIAVDEQHKRMAYGSVEGRATHHNAAFQVFADGGKRCRIVWITDLLPDEVVAPVEMMMDKGIEVMKKALPKG